MGSSCGCDPGRGREGNIVACLANFERAAVIMYVFYVCRLIGSRLIILYVVCSQGKNKRSRQNTKCVLNHQSKSLCLLRCLFIRLNADKRDVPRIRAYPPFNFFIYEKYVKLCCEGVSLKRGGCIISYLFFMVFTSEKNRVKYEGRWDACNADDRGITFRLK